MNDSWTASCDMLNKLTPLPHPIIRLDKMETYAEILVTVGNTAPLWPSLSSNCWPPCESHSKLSTGTEASISIGTSFLAWDFTLSPCHLHITLNQNQQWATGRKKNKKARARNKTVALRFRGRHFMKWRCDKTLLCVCV